MTVGRAALEEQDSAKATAPDRKLALARLIVVAKGLPEKKSFQNQTELQ
jgi:hypothetical protein